MNWCFQTAFVTNFLTLICVTTLIFASWQKGSQCWQRFAPGFFYLLVILNFLIFPAINIIYQVFIAAYPVVICRDSYWESFLVFFMVSCVGKPIQYFVTIRTTFIRDARSYIETRKIVQDMTEEQLT